MTWKSNLKKISTAILYGIFVGVSMPYYIKISRSLYNNFVDKNIVFNLDTLFLNWNTSFPAVTICELYNGETVWDLGEQYFGPEHDIRLDDVIGEIVYFHGTCSSCNKCENQNLPCPKNFTHLLKMFRTNCSDLIINCKYQNKVFNCCDKFYPIHTEYGVCFAFNSNQAKLVELLYEILNFKEKCISNCSTKKYTEYSINRAVGLGFLNFEVTADIHLNIHPPLEIPNQSTDDMIKETLLLGSRKEIVLNAMEVFNNPNLYKINYEERKCRYAHEMTDLGRELKLYEFYSFSTCIVECVIGIQLKLCNCANHFLVKRDSLFKICDYNGLICLTNHYNDFVEYRQQCNCMSPCDEPEYNIIYNSADDRTKKSSNITKIKILLAELPTMRLERRVDKTNLDLMISIGELAGLFFNTSLIHIVELVLITLCRFWMLLKMK